MIPKLHLVVLSINPYFFQTSLFALAFMQSGKLCVFTFFIPRTTLKRLGNTKKYSLLISISVI
jgi:hypothetical protein